MIRSTSLKIRIKFPPPHRNTNCVCETKLEFLLGVIAFPEVNTTPRPLPLVSHFHKASCLKGFCRVHPHHALVAHNLCKTLWRAAEKGCCGAVCGEQMARIHRLHGGAPCRAGMRTELELRSLVQRSDCSSSSGHKN